MQVTLAGYNVDVGVIASLGGQDVTGNFETGFGAMTPEVISAAYARISRDPRPIGELRAEAAEDVEKARKSNQSIVFGMGHASIAEHAVFNFDIVGISRLAIEYLESHRLCSYTERSQRYCQLGGDYVVPHEFLDSALRTSFEVLVQQASALYMWSVPLLTEYFQTQNPKDTTAQCTRYAQEDARYVMLMATSGQLGLTASARNLELIIRRCASSPLRELQEMGKQLHEAASAVAPSLFRHVKSYPYDQQRVFDIRRYVEKELIGRGFIPEEYSVPNKEVILVDVTPGADEVVCAVLMHGAMAGGNADWCGNMVKVMSSSQMKDLVTTALRHLEFYDAAPREFEHVQFTFELLVSASCFAQLKRHRMMTLSPQRYDPLLDPTVPKSIKETGLEAAYLYHCRAAAEVYDAIAEDHGHHVAEYALTNGHRRRVLVTMNLRELYHFSRMRQDAHAQWDIRNIADQMVKQAREVAPLGTMLVCGKDTFHEKVAREYDAEWAKQKQRP